ncbi:MAG TPA: hypothetical protein VKA06_11165 [Spirochaetia bacterium]|nr:hypothetical protein [Spirochaetia bacterium]
MLREWKGVRQRPEEGPRRWFTDDDMDLIVWYDKAGGNIRGFQLCYGKQTSQHAVTWLADGSTYSHARIDDGEEIGGIGLKQTPILVEDGRFDPVGLADRFRERAEMVEAGIRDLVVARLRGFPAR